MSTDEHIHKELSEAIIGAAMKVLNALRPGLKEKAYENALVLELRRKGHVIEQQRSFDVLYDGVVVDTLIPDLIVDGKVIVDPKCVTAFTETHFARIDRLSLDHRPSSCAPIQFQRGQVAMEAHRALIHL